MVQQGGMGRRGVKGCGLCIAGVGQGPLGSNPLHGHARRGSASKGAGAAEDAEHTRAPPPPSPHTRTRRPLPSPHLAPRQCRQHVQCEPAQQVGPQDHTPVRDLLKEDARGCKDITEKCSEVDSRRGGGMQEGGAVGRGGFVGEAGRNGISVPTRYTVDPRAGPFPASSCLRGAEVTARTLPHPP